MNKDQRRIFGTDGVRGTTNTYPMTAEAVLRLGMATGVHFQRGPHRHRAVIGKDTRLSGYMLEPALVSGLVSVGMDVVLVGPLPTPAIAMLTKSLRADVGIMLSASHNAYQDNGVKLFDPNGYKLCDGVEEDIETIIHKWDQTVPDHSHLAPPAALGRAKRLDDASGRYVEYVKRSFPAPLRLDGLSVVLDCANGAAYKVAPDILRELGAHVTCIGIAPDGFNINQNCGSTHPDALCQAVVANRADCGIALDGDADRMMLCDEKGALIDGDQIMALIATDWNCADRLNHATVVATDMSNLGLEQYLAKHDITLKRAKVGDRYVSELMRREGYNFGGEQSGHLIMGDYNATGDGIMASLQALAVLIRRKAPASNVFHLFTPLPQELINVRYDRNTTPSPLQSRTVESTIETAKRDLKKDGRLLVRPSGTEPLIRVMVECADAAKAKSVATRVADAITAVGTSPMSAS